MGKKLMGAVFSMLCEHNQQALYFRKAYKQCVAGTLV